MRSIFCAAAVAAVLLSAGFTSQVAQADSYAFAQFAVSSVYKGKAQMPVFDGRDRAYRDYRTRIRNGLKQGPNFAGHYSVIQFGCGTGCSLVFVADNRTGQVFDFPRGGEDNMYMQLSFRPDSRLMAVQWGSHESETCVLEYLEWDGKTAVPLDKRQLGNLEACYTGIAETLSKQ